jgi:hypothetical protein
MTLKDWLAKQDEKELQEKLKGLYEEFESDYYENAEGRLISYRNWLERMIIKERDENAENKIAD